MKHRSHKVILSRKKSARTALMKNLANSLIYYEKIITTQAKAKALKPYLEKLITKGKANNLTTRRYLLRYLQAKATKKILEILGPRFLNRSGGYLSITKIAKPRNDSAKMAIIKFV